MSAATKAIAVVRTMFFRLIYAQTWILQRLHTIFHVIGRYHTMQQPALGYYEINESRCHRRRAEVSFGGGTRIRVWGTNTSPVGSKGLGLCPRYNVKFILL